MKQRLKLVYQEQVVKRIIQKFDYNNVHQIPKITKISVNQGVNFSKTESARKDLDIIVSQKSLKCRSRKAIAGFKIREGVVVGRKATIRSKRIFSFIDRIFSLAFPRIRDFQGLRETRFDSSGNFSFGLEEQLMFPEIKYDQVESLCGIGVTFVSSSNNKTEAKVLLEIIGLPFQYLKWILLYKK